MKTNNRIKLIVLSVSMLASMGSFATDNPADQNGNQVATADARQPIQQTGGQYQVRPGETLNQIAARVRPSNMSLSETAKAIVQANPDIFKNGNPNLIFAGDILRIPTGNQISGAPTTPAQQAPAAPTKPAATEQPAPPATDSKTASAKADQAASNKATQTTSSSVASAPAASASPVASTTASQEATPAPASESSGGSSLPWILIGGIGLAALLFLNKLRGNKQAKESTSVTPASKTDKAPAPAASSKPAQTAAAATAAAAAAKTTAADSDDLQTSDDDFSESTENLFFSDVDPRVEEPTSSDDFNLDLGAIGNQQGIVSSAVTNDEETLKRADVDWDNLESTESVYEDDIPTSAAEKQPVAVSEVEEAPVEFEDSVVEVVEATETETLTHADEALEFEAAAPVIEETYEQPVVATQVITEPVEVETTPADEPVDEIEAESIVAAEEEPLEFESVAAEPITPAAPVEEITIAEIEANAEPTATVATEAEEATWTAEETFASEEIASEEVGQLKTDTGFETVEALSDAQEENFNVAPIAITEASDDDVIEWESVNFADDDKEVGFISESVGMTAPLEAKYELAQMYIEIGDPDAARETLNELVEEANGDILEKSKALLAEIS